MYVINCCRVIASAKERLTYISKRTEASDLTSDDKLPDLLLDLANYRYDDLVQRSLLLLDRYYTSQTDIFQKALHTQLLKTAESIKLYNTIEGLFLKLVMFLRTGSVERVPGPSPVKELTKYCWLEEEVEGFEPHQINQNIILSFGRTDFLQLHATRINMYSTFATLHQHMHALSM